LGLFLGKNGTVPFWGRFRFRHCFNEADLIDFDLLRPALALSRIGEHADCFQSGDGGDHSLAVQAGELAQPLYRGIGAAGFLVVALGIGKRYQLLG